MAFEVYPYERTCAPSKQRLGITLNTHGQLLVNAATCAALGRPSHVLLLYDRATRTIGVQACGEGERHALRVSSPHGEPRSRRVSAKGFCTYFDLQPYQGQRYRGEMRDGILHVTLDDRRKGGTNDSASIKRTATRPWDIPLAGALSLPLPPVRAGIQRQEAPRRGRHGRRKGLAAT